jgi:diadenosine tetraphosphate (Ap4A) HIT family hydrolase
MHVIPRYNGDHVDIPWTHLKYEEGEAAALAEKIAARIK